MPKELKIILLCFFLFAIFTGWVVVKTNQTATISNDLAGVQAAANEDQFGNVPRLGGVVVKEYTFKNSTNQPMKLGRLTTSCMCTKAKVVIGNQESDLYGMESAGALNPPLGWTLNPGESGKVVVDFDPNAHGPQGVGPFRRVIQLYFQDPSGVKQFKFAGTII
ncbi:DUF1573 domain-containing protein [Patescibacteria group bacterium]|nr:DUF1573 domain-containing protein [Patescibacteria group bacterium]